jgi:WD40 repeat protein
MTGEYKSLPHQLKGAITHVRFDPTSSKVALADAHGMVRIWDAITLAPLTPILKHDGELSAVDFSHDGRELFAITNSGSVRSWNLVAKFEVQTLRPRQITALAELLANARIDEQQQITALTAGERRDDLQIVREAMPDVIPAK